MLSVTPELMTDPSCRDAAPDCFAIPGSENERLRVEGRLPARGLPHDQGRRRRDLLRGEPRHRRALARRGVPVCGLAA